MSKLHARVLGTLRCSHIWGAILVFTLASLFPAHAEIYTEKGERHYRCFGANFSLEDGRLSDGQAMKILRYVKDSYENNLLNEHILDIWQNLDALYDGGKYHGEIMLTILKTYLNQAFDGYHNTLLPSYGHYQKYGGTVEIVIPKFAWIYWDKARLHDELRYDYSSCTDHIYAYSYGAAYKIIPNLKQLVENGKGASTILSLQNPAGCFRSPDDAVFEAQNQIEKNYSKVKIANYSARNSSSHISSAVQYIYQTVFHQDSIFLSGAFDHTLLKIMEQFPNTQRRYGDFVSRSLYREIVNKIYRVAGEPAKQKMLELANKYELQIKRPSVSRKAF